ncbi:MAG: diadenylate cyclase CdaA [Bacilli bacterium]|nr:diadenylate cyclase CdaA [Bacilli bacterium]MCI6932841.1 diadenylate cyclase CdaA [Mycoplasmatota bacterium]
MTFTSIWSIITKIIDISLVWLMFYYLLKNLKNNIKLVLIFKGAALIIAIKIISNLLDLYTIGMLLEYVISWGPLALIIIFQPEIRNILESIGRSQLLGRHKVLTVDEREKVVFEIVSAVEYLKRNRIGALIVIERNVSLQDYIAPANKIYSDITAPLLEAIFFPNNPLHDGGVIIQGDKLTCAGAVFKTSMNPNVSKKLGTRHRAALGVAEETDAIALVVSEETGRISIAVDNYLNYNLTLEEFKLMLLDELKPKMDVFYDADEEVNSDEDI